MSERGRIDVLKCMTADVRKCRYPPPCVKCIAGGPLATHQISVWSVRPFPRYGKGGTSAPAHADVPIHSVQRIPSSTFVKGLANRSLTIPNFSAICPAVSEIRKTGAHVRTCGCAPPLSFAKSLANGSLTRAGETGGGPRDLPPGPHKWQFLGGPEDPKKTKMCY